MNKLLLTLLVSFSLNAQFKIQDGNLIWQKVFEKDLDLKNQRIRLNPKSYAYIYWISFADMKVEKKDGKTRITLTEWYKTGDSNTLETNTIFGDIDYDLTNLVVKRKTGEIRKGFAKKSAGLLNDAILIAIERLLKEDKNDNW